MSFLDSSKKIANEFLQNIIFIDDKAYDLSSSDEHDFNAEEVSNYFAKENKICAIYKPKTIDDINILSKITKKSDVCVLDWRISLKNDDTSSANESEIDENDDDRGEFAKQIIANILQDTICKESIKLIVIYTGERGLEKIIRQIQSIQDIDIKTLDATSLKYKNIKICAISKNELKYENLPKYILDEFTELTSGLLSNFALKALTTIRNNTGAIISLFNKDLDLAYLEHQFEILNPEDANKLLINLIIDIFITNLEYNGLDNMLDKILVGQWLKNQNFAGEKERLIDILFKDYRNKQDCKYILDSNLFNNETINKSRIDFAKLTHHKKPLIQIENFIPKLTQGVVVKSTKTNMYYVCIQQKCDCARIKQDEKRRFLFISLKCSKITDKTKFDYITPDNFGLQLEKKSYNLRTIKFKSQENSDIILARKENDKFIFNAIENETLEWIFELKDLHTQRIINNYCAILSRVGLNESEWLRVKSK